MGIIEIEGTHNTPSVVFDRKQGKLEIKGRSLPENPTEFYLPIIEGLQRLARNLIPSFQADIQLDYLNTSSTRSMLHIFKCLNTLQSKGCQVKVNWYYEDDDIQKVGESYEVIVGMKINMIHVPRG